MTIRSTPAASRRGLKGSIGVDGGGLFSSRFALCLIYGFMVLGCAGDGEKYTPLSLPKELAASRRDNVQTLDLTRLARATANSDVIDRGDVIEVSISAGLDEKDTITIPIRVDDQGLAKLPEIGPVSLAGLDMQSAEAEITAACIDRQLYRGPNVTVTMKHQRTNRVMVTGAVKNPDVYELPRGRSDLLSAIVAAGGLDKDAGPLVEIRNPKDSNRYRRDPVARGLPSDVHTAGLGVSPDGGDPSIQGVGGIAADEASQSLETVRINLVTATKLGTGDYQVADGGVVNIEKRDPEPLHVLGLVKKADRYDFPINEEFRVTDAIAIAGGVSVPMADKVFIVRRKPNSSDTAVIQISLRQAKRNAASNLRLEPGDVLSVEETPGTVLYQTLMVFRFNIGGSIPLANFF
jgi:polysaccharide biosynthesis/export protein